MRALLLIQLLLTVSCAAGSAPAARAATAAHRFAGGVAPPLHARGRDIVDSAGRRVRLRCASWSGGQEKWYVPSGMWARPRAAIARKAAAALLNCVRLVWSLEAVLRAANGTAVVPHEAMAANPDLKDRSPLEVMDAVIAAITAEGLMVILDNHSSDAMWCCGLQDGNGLWYTNRWSEADWVRGWALLARRYANTTGVVGAGLRNEPRPAVIGGVLRVPTWGTGGAMADLAVAYEKAAAAVLSRRPSTLIFAQGLVAGRDLRAARARPLVLRRAWPAGQVVKGQLAYEVHEYPWLWGNFNFTDYPAYRAALDEAWGYLALEGTAPIWLGEFGTSHDQAGISSPWWKALMRYIKERDLDWSYWPLDGQQGPSRQKGALETYGLLNTTWDGWAYPPLMEQLWAIT
ncbi:MAG: glycoside hydrolase superfamily [Monoraphidium minutum]|nr:MAG: glycoside hydrolase superfamily [Monoraphidium minutum]